MTLVLRKALRRGLIVICTRYASMVAALSIGVPGSAWAWGGLIEPQPPATVLSSATTASASGLATAPLPDAATGLVQLGAPQIGTVISAGFGKKVPLGMALKMLVPSNWISGTEGVPESTPVSWRGGQSWPQALAEIASSHDWTAIVDWGGHTVTMEASKGAVARPVPLVGTSTRSSGAVTTDIAASGKPTPPAISFVLEAGQPIEQQLIAWANKARWGAESQDHWAVLWSVPHNWTNPGTLDYGHDFVKAITQVVRTMAENGADARIQVKEANHVVLIHPAGAQP